MATYQIQTTLDNDSALAEDKVVNTWHVFGDISGITSAEWLSAFTKFFGTASGAMSNTVMARLSSALNGAGRVKVYNLADPKPRPPIVDTPFSGLIPGGTALPAEVATCLSFRANDVAGVHRQRRRNRVYIGPLAQSALESNTNASIASAFRTDLLIALQTLKNDIATSSGGTASLVGYSPTDATWFPIEYAWVDDAPDIQRRRGKAPTVRTGVVMV